MNDLRSNQLKFKVFSASKKTLSRVVVLATLVLIILPFWASFQDALTQFVMRVELYRSLQNVIVPYELRIVGTLLIWGGLPIKVGNAYIEWSRISGGSEVIYLAWNCVGWQTLTLFLVTLVSGLSGQYSLVSKLEALAIGILGTYLVNLARLTLVVVVYFMVGRPFGIVFHDYFTSILTLAWLFFFWWFSYTFVLVPKGSKIGL